MLILDYATLDEYPPLNAKAAQDFQNKVNHAVEEFVSTGMEMKLKELNKRTQRELKRIDDELAKEKDKERRAQLQEERRGVQEGHARQEKKIREEGAAMRQAKVAVNTVNMAEDGYTIRQTGVSTDTPGLQVSLYDAWLRNGTAGVEISFGGNMAPAEMDGFMHFFLAEMDGRTMSYATD